MEPGGGSVDAAEDGRGAGGSSRRGLVVVTVVGVVVVALVVGAVWWGQRPHYRSIDSPWHSVAVEPDGRTLVFYTYGSGSCGPDSVAFEGDPTRDAEVVATTYVRKAGTMSFCTADLGMNGPVTVTLDGPVREGLVVVDGSMRQCGARPVKEGAFDASSAFGDLMDRCPGAG